MPYPRRKFLQQSLAASAAGMLSPLNAVMAMEQNEAKFILDQKHSAKKIIFVARGPTRRLFPQPPKLLKKEQHDGYTLEYLDFDFNGLERVPGTLLVPDN
jgi:hypothetical protein